MTKQFDPDSKYRAVFSTAALVTALSVTLKFAEDHLGSRTALLTFRPGELSMRTEDLFYSSEADEVIACDHNAPEGHAIACEIVYLTEFARACVSEEIEMRFGGPMERLRLTHRGDSGYVYLAMPCHPAWVRREA